MWALGMELPGVVAWSGRVNLRIHHHGQIALFVVELKGNIEVPILDGDMLKAISLVEFL